MRVVRTMKCISSRAYTVLCPAWMRASGAIDSWMSIASRGGQGVQAGARNQLHMTLSLLAVGQNGVAVARD